MKFKKIKKNRKELGKIIKEIQELQNREQLFIVCEEFTLDTYDILSDEKESIYVEFYTSRITNETFVETFLPYSELLNIKKVLLVFLKELRKIKNIKRIYGKLDKFNLVYTNYETDKLFRQRVYKYNDTTFYNNLLLLKDLEKDKIRVYNFYSSNFTEYNNLEEAKKATCDCIEFNSAEKYFECFE